MNESLGMTVARNLLASKGNFMFLENVIDPCIHPIEIHVSRDGDEIHVLRVTPFESYFLDANRYFDSLNEDQVLNVIINSCDY